MAFYDKFPYTNFQELNLDWLTQEVSKVRDNRDATDASAAAALASEQAAKASETAAAASQQAAKASQQAAAGSEAASADYLAQIGTHTAGAAADWLKENLTTTTPPVDASLTVSGAAADAKKTGDAVSELKNGLDQSLVAEYNGEWEAGYVSADGSILHDGENNSKISQAITTKSVNISIKFSESHDLWFGIGAWANDGSFLERKVYHPGNSDKLSFSYTAPEGTSYVRISFRAYDEDYTMSVKYYCYLKNTVESVNELKNDLGLRIVAEYNGKWEAGYVSEDGSILYDGQGENNNKISQAITTKSVNISIKFAKSHDLWFGIGAWANDGSFLGRQVYHPGNSDKLSFSYTAPEGTSYVRISFRAYDEDYTMAIKYYYYLKNTIETIRALTRECNDNISAVASLANFSGRFRPCYDHLFVEDGSNSVIPHESLYHVRLSRRFGFNTIEANIAKTSDGVYIVTHLYEGAFWNWFHHVDGKTDISATLVSSVTWDWIVKNVRYNSTIKKYQTRPCRLEEFLSECRQQNIIPFIYTEDVNVLAMANEYMGKDNYIAYGASRANAPTAIIYHWAYETSKEAILRHCENVGKPFIYGMGNPTAFTDSELKEIVDAVHSAGYWIGTSYADPMWYKYSYIGFDFNGTQTRINRIDNGNICNLSSAFGFDEFEVVNGAEADGILTFSSNGTISPNVPSTVFPFCGIDLQIDFTGTIVVPTIGKHARTQYTSDGSMPFFVAVPILNGSPHLTVEVMSGTIIRDISFKASKF